MGKESQRSRYAHQLAIHDPYFAGFFGAEPGIELVHAHLGTVLATKPNRPAADQVADHDTVTVPLANRDFVDADGSGVRLAGSAELLGHVLLVQLLNRVSIEVQILGHGLDSTVPAASSDEESKTLGVEGIFGQPTETFGLHGMASEALNAANEEVEIDAPIAAGEIAEPSWSLIAKGWRRLPAAATERFFTAPESEHDGPGVAKDAMEGGPWRESGEPVAVPKLSWCWHESIVTRFRGFEKAILQGKNGVFTGCIGNICPLRDAKNLKNDKMAE